MRVALVTLVLFAATAAFATPRIVSAEPAALAFPSATCQGETATVRFAWQPAPGATEQWLDLSLFENDFAPESFVGAGPMPPSQNELTWSGILTGQAHFWRLNTLTSEGWQPSLTGRFVACGGPVLASEAITCEPDGSYFVYFRWSPVLDASLQWLDISKYDNGFELDTFGGVGPLTSQTDAFEFPNLLQPYTQYFFRVNALTSEGWRTTETQSFIADSCA